MYGYIFFMKFVSNLINIIANIEVNIDYPEYDDVDILSNEVLKPSIIKLSKDIENLLEKASFGKVIKDGIRTGIKLSADI